MNIQLYADANESEIRDALNKCQSPLERLFLPELLASLRERSESGRAEWSGFSWCIEVQPAYADLQTGGDGSYMSIPLGRCDFAVCMRDQASIASYVEDAARQAAE